MRPGHLLAILALLLSTIAWAAESAAPAPKLVRIHVEAPEYPANARRFNVSGTVIAKMRIETDGQVSKTEIVQSPADILSKAVIETTAKWRYQPIAEPYEGIVQIPFQLTGEGESYALSTDVRPFSAPAPTAASDLGVDLTEGWSHVRLMIDATGTVTSTLVLKSSGPEFGSSRDAILAKLKFNPAAEGVKGFKATTVNLFFIRVVTGGEIRINQLSGV